MGEIKLFNINYPLNKMDDLELVETLRDACDTYSMCRHEISTSSSDAWSRVVHLSKEVIRRTGTWRTV